MSVKGSITTSDYLPYEDYKRLVQTLIDEHQYWWATYCILSFCTGLRFSDASRLRWDDVLDQRRIVIVAKKTKKTHSIPIGANAQKHFLELYDKLGRPDPKSVIFSLNGGKIPITIQYVNRELKKFAKKYNLNIENFSTHTFRKTFGRYIYDKQGQSEKALIYLNQIFKHTSIQTTMVYLGIRDEEITNIFNSIEVS